MNHSRIHATAISYQGTGCLITGPSGSGKSRIAQEAMLLGARLIADDQVELSLMSGLVAASPVANLAGMMEIRGLGIIRVGDALARHILHVVVELDPTAQERLPQPRQIDLLGLTLPALRVAPPPVTPVAGLLLYLRALQQGMVMPTDWRPDFAA